ncbi:MAG: hypothetical protein RRZ24_11995, partial [Clostridia bacterium]
TTVVLPANPTKQKRLPHDVRQPFLFGSLMQMNGGVKRQLGGHHIWCPYNRDCSNSWLARGVACGGLQRFMQGLRQFMVGARRSVWGIAAFHAGIAAIHGWSAAFRVGD